MFIGIGEKPLDIGAKAPEFLLPSTTGHDISLKDYAGKKLFLFFFRGTWCPQCGNHMRQINRELDELTSLGVHILGICCQALPPMQAFVKREKINFPILSDQERTAAKDYGVYTYLSWDSINIARPSFFYINEQGIIQYRYIGEHQWDRPDMAEIKALVKDSSAGTTPPARRAPISGE